MRLEVPEMAGRDRIQRRSVSSRSFNKKGGKYGCSE